MNNYLPQLAVRAFIENTQKQILILKRKNSTFMDGIWCLPGGKIDFGETAEQAIIKEIKEETNLTSNKSKFLFYMDNLPTKDYHTHFVTLFFECDCMGEIQLNNESSDSIWINQNELANHKIAFEHEKAILNYIKINDEKRKSK